MKRRRGRRKRRPMGKRIAFALIAIVIFFVVIEVGCRIAFPDLTGQQPFGKFNNPHLQQTSIYEHDPVLFWKLRPGNKGYKVNEQGYRGKASGPEKVPDEIRIICLGDSCTFGIGPEEIQPEQAYPAILENILKEKLPGKKVSVLNFGCPGYTSFQGKHLLRKKGLQYDPDVVTAYFAINDFYPAVGFPDGEQRPMVDPPALPPSITKALHNCCLYEALVRLIYGARLSAKAATEETQRVPLPDYHVNLDAISAMGKKNGFATYFINSPYLGEDQKVSFSAEYTHEPALPVKDVFAKVQEEGIEPLFGPPDNVHPTVEGHKIIAQIIADRLVADKPWEK